MVEIKYSVYDTSCTPLVNVQPVTEIGFHQESCLTVTDAVPAPVSFDPLSQDTVSCETITETSSLLSTDSRSSINEENSRDLTDQPHDEQQCRLATAAGVASAALGLLICGPIGAVMLGCGAAYAVENKPEGSGVGDAARAVGDVALVAAERARVINSRHHIVEHTKRISQTSYNMIDQIDRDYRILERTTNVVTYSWNKTVDFVRRENIVRRSVNSVGYAVCWAAEKIANALSTTSGTNGTETVRQRYDDNRNSDISHRPYPTAPVEPRMASNLQNRPAVLLY